MTNDRGDVPSVRVQRLRLAAALISIFLFTVLALVAGAYSGMRAKELPPGGTAPATGSPGTGW